jgi:myo-inositol-1(or 4)-monophosphatase
MHMLDHQLASELLKTAGTIAMESFRKVTPSRKKDKSLVTAADCAIQRYLTNQFSRRFPSVGLIAEENHLRKAPSEGKTYFVIDPIDGTASFVCGLPIWGIAVGVIEDLQPIAGYFLMPATGDFFYTTVDGRVYRNDTEIRSIVPKIIQRESVLLTVSRFHKKYQIDSAYPGKVRCLGSTIAHVCYAATGSADAAIVSDIHVWDIAAGLAIALLNGAVAQYLNGETFVLNESMLDCQVIDNPILVGQRTTIEAYRQIIRLKT